MTTQDSTPIEQIANFDWQKFRDDLTGAIEDMTRLQKIAEIQIAAAAIPSIQTSAVTPVIQKHDPENLLKYAQAANIIAALHERGWTYKQIALLVNENRGWEWAPITSSGLNAMVLDRKRGLENGPFRGISHPKKLTQIIQILNPFLSQLVNGGRK